MKTADVVLSKRCNDEHQHVQMLDNNAKLTKEYPEELCRACLGHYGLNEVTLSEAIVLKIVVDFCGGLDRDEDLDIKGELREEIGQWTPQWFDDCTGQPLAPAKIRLGRARGYEKIAQRKVYEPVLRTKAMKSTDANFILTKCVDNQKGEDGRCRFVGQEFAAGDSRTDLFASTPTLFLARTVVSMAAWERARPWSLMALNVSCAFLYAKVLQEIYIEHFCEVPLALEGQYVDRLWKSLCETRDAPQLWQKDLVSTLKDIGFTNSHLRSRFFYHKGRDIALISHVDDLLIGGTSGDLVWARKSLERKYDNKWTDELKFLGRRIDGRIRNMSPNKTSDKVPSPMEEFLRYYKDSTNEKLRTSQRAGVEAYNSLKPDEKPKFLARFQQNRKDFSWTKEFVAEEETEDNCATLTLGGFFNRNEILRECGFDPSDLGDKESWALLEVLLEQSCAEFGHERKTFRQGLLALVIVWCAGTLDRRLRCQSGLSQLGRRARQDNHVEDLETEAGQETQLRPRHHLGVGPQSGNLPVLRKQGRGCRVRHGSAHILDGIMMMMITAHQGRSADPRPNE